MYFRNTYISSGTNILISSNYKQTNNNYKKIIKKLNKLIKNSIKIRYQNNNILTTEKTNKP